MTTPSQLPETPCLMVDDAVLDRNLRRYQSYCDEHGLRFRPHVKTHKMREIATRQLSLGAAGLACQKLAEAEILLEDESVDVMIASNIVGHAKLERLARLASRARISVTVDSEIVARGLADAAGTNESPLRLWVDCDTGLRRTGVQSADEAIRLATALASVPGVELAGLFTYPTPVAGSWFEDAVSRWQRAQLPGPDVSVGGTPGAFHTHALGYATELRAGTYVFMDLYCLEDGSAQLADCALTVHATCISRPTPTRAVLDSGSKALGLDRVDVGSGPLYGLLKHNPVLGVTEVFEEHGLITSDDPALLPRIGERVEIIPAHCCYTVNLHDQVWVRDQHKVIDSWNVAARGAFG
jgi:D-serine deaminase-like pyridoxal phosphate-dependent protein